MTSALKRLHLRSQGQGVDELSHVTGPLTSVPKPLTSTDERSLIQLRQPSGAARQVLDLVSTYPGVAQRVKLMKNSRKSVPLKSPGDSRNLQKPPGSQAA